MTDRSVASWSTILAVLIAELALAAALAYLVAQGYLSYNCADHELARETAETCQGGFPYPLY